MEKKVTKRGFGQHPWGYPESFTIAFSTLILGFIIQAFTGTGVSLPGWPVNIIIAAIFILYIFLIHRFVKHPVVKWFSSPQAAIAAISVFTILVLLMGFIPQRQAEAPEFLRLSGLNFITRSWAYLMTALLLLIILGFTIIRRFLPITVKNMAFFLNHAGLWIVIVAASLGSADLWRLSLPVEEGGVSFTAYDVNNKAYRLPFAVKLIDFEIEEYSPRLGLMRNSDGTLKMKKGDKLFEVEKGKEGMLDQFKLFVVNYYENSRKDSLRYDTSSMVGAAPAALVVAIDTREKDTVLGWISSGSFNVSPSYLPLNREVSLAMISPSPEKYSSKIRIFETMEEYHDFTVEVNKPVKFSGWKIYQVGYNERMGKWSNYSILELVKDPWLPVVYIGIFMILAGSLYLVWMGRAKKMEEK